MEVEVISFEKLLQRSALKGSLRLIHYGTLSFLRTQKLPDNQVLLLILSFLGILKGTALDRALHVGCQPP